MKKRSFKSLIKKVILCISIIFSFSLLFHNYSYADDRMTDEEILENYQDFKGMLNEIFSLNDDPGLSPIFNPSSMLVKVNESLMLSIESFSHSRIYNLFIGIGFLFLFINFLMCLYQNRTVAEALTKEQIAKSCISLIIALVLIFNLINLITSALYIFQFVLQNVIDFKNDTNTQSTGMTDFINSALIDIVRKCGADHIANHKVGWLEGLKNNIAIIWVRVEFIIPWLLAMVGKFGSLTVILKNGAEILLNVMVLPISMADLPDNIKNSNGIRHFKKILSLALQQSTIILAIVTVNQLMMHFVDAIPGSIGDNALMYGILFAIFQLVKVGVVMTVSKVVSDSAIGV